MLHMIEDLENFSIHAAGDDIGLVKDLYFDDKKWIIRYFIVETGSWLLSRKVLLLPAVIKQLNLEDKTLSVNISLAQVKDSPDIDTDKPVSRQHEVEYLRYYGYPNYWDTGELGYPDTPYPDDTTPTRESGNSPDSHGHHKKNDLHLRSCKNIIGYYIHATDGDIGHVQELLIDEDTWTIRYFIVNTGNWWVGHQVLIAAEWITDINWIENKVYVDLTRELVQQAPLFDPLVPVNREQELGIHLHYGRKGYWEA